MSAIPFAIDIGDELAKLGFLADRTPSSSESSNADAVGGPWASEVAPYRDGSIYLVHYSGSSEWERHRQGDEMVMVIEGATTMFFLIDDIQNSVHLASGQMVVVPQGIWHRFETPDGAKIMAITPQPTDHSIDLPG